MFSSDNSPSSSSSSSTRSSPIHHASLVDASTHSPALLQLVDVKLSRQILGESCTVSASIHFSYHPSPDYVVDCVADTVDFAMGRPPLPPNKRLSRRAGLSSFTTFVTNVYTRAEVTMPVILSSLAYIDRAKPHLHIALEEWALERVFLGALILASKVWSFITRLLLSKLINDISTPTIPHWRISIGHFVLEFLGNEMLVELSESFLTSWIGSWVSLRRIFSLITTVSLPQSLLHLHVATLVSAHPIQEYLGTTPAVIIVVLVRNSNLLVPCHRKALHHHKHRLHWTVHPNSFPSPKLLQNSSQMWLSEAGCTRCPSRLTTRSNQYRSQYEFDSKFRMFSSCMITACLPFCSSLWLSLLHFTTSIIRIRSVCPLHHQLQRISGIYLIHIYSLL